MYFKALEEGNLEEFDYVRKGKNIPPSKHGRPEPDQEQLAAQQQAYQEQLAAQQRQDYGDEAADYYPEQQEGQQEDYDEGY